MNFDQAPMLVIWEVTQACDLACVHCRASAQPERNPAELSTEQGYRLLDEIRSFGAPLMVFTGGDPLKRPDLYELIRYSVKIGLRTNVTPAPRPLLTAEAIEASKRPESRAWPSAWTGRTRPRTTSFRGIPGTFDRAMFALRHARDIGLDTQLQTTVSRRNMGRLAEVAEIAKEVRTRMWSLFFLIVTGRAEEGDDLLAPEYEQVFEFMYELSKTAPFGVKTTEAMHYRRYVAQRIKAEHGATENENAKGVAWRTAGVSDGKGFVFVSHHGRDFPSGFFPVSGGNVLRFADRCVPELRPVPDSARYQPTHGKCGICEYRNMCGGSRSRAYALTGDYLAEDPRCIYQPHMADALAG
jgi:MoaA/NifB/PqqE/SkfB family radical SAM enzyme